MLTNVRNALRIATLVSCLVFLLMPNQVIGQRRRASRPNDTMTPSNPNPVPVRAVDACSDFLKGENELLLEIIRHLPNMDDQAFKRFQEREAETNLGSPSEQMDIRIKFIRFKLTGQR
jgi:hypothetical protein